MTWIGTKVLPQTFKIVLIVNSDNLEARKMFGSRHGFKVCTGACYLGRYMGENESKREWMKERMGTWERKIFTIRKTAGKYPQRSYAAVVCAIKLEYIFIEHVITNMGDMFSRVETIIQETVFPCLFFRKKETSYP